MEEQQQTPIIVRIQDPNKLQCLQRLNECVPRPYTQFVLFPPKIENGKWDMQSRVQYELVEKDAAVVVLLKKGLTVNEAHLALWSVSKVLQEASEAAIKEKKRILALATRQKGWFTYFVKYLIPVATKRSKEIAIALFNVPVILINMVKRLHKPKEK